MELTVFKTLFDVLVELVKSSVVLKKADVGHRKEIAKWMDDLAELILGIVPNIIKNEYSDDSHDQMKTLVEIFPNVIKDALTDEEIKKLHDRLVEAEHIETLFLEMNSLDTADKFHYLIQLKQAAGRLKGVAGALPTMQ